MEKSMYSLILIDEVVRKIDELAHTRGTSRSGLVNQILADHVSFLTPARRVEEIFEHIASELRAAGGLQLRQNSPGTLSAKSVLTYRYNPAIRYNVEIAPEEGQYICRLKVGSRTQSDSLRSRLSMFYEIWSQIEAVTLRKLREDIDSAINGERFRRTLQIEKAGALPPGDILGKAIGAYIRMFDAALKLSFASDHGMDMQTYQKIAALYKEHIEHSELRL